MDNAEKGVRWFLYECTTLNDTLSVLETEARSLVRTMGKARFDPASGDRTQTQLLTTLAAIRLAKTVPGSVYDAVHRLRHSVEPALAAQPVPRGWLARHRQQRQRTETLRSIWDAPDTQGLRHTVTQWLQALDPRSYDHRAVYQDYQRNAAAFHAELERFTTPTRVPDAEAFPVALRREVDATELDTRLLKATLRGYQRFGARYAVRQRYSILGDEMGLGKTLQALAAMAHLAVHGRDRFLVVCPASVQENWLSEITRHSELQAHRLHGADRDEATEGWLRDGGVAVTTFGTLGRLKGLTEIGLLVVDEAHYAKNPEAKRTRNVMAVIPASERVLFLTGTPIENRVDEFRNLIGYLRPDIAGALSGSEAHEAATQFRRRIAPVYLRRNQEDVLTELPPKYEIEEWVGITGPEYAAAEREGSFMAMRQASLSSKLDRLMELVEEAEETGQKVIVFSYFRDALERVARRVGERAVGPLTGAIPSSARQRMVDDFNQRDGSAVLVSQIEAGGVGLNVQSASVVIIVEPQWKPSVEAQAIARAHRMGQTRTVMVYRLFAKVRTDAHVRRVQDHKRQLVEQFARVSDAKLSTPEAVDRSQPTIVWPDRDQDAVAAL